MSQIREIVVQHANNQFLRQSVAAVAILSCVAAGPAAGQQPVAVGKGSYAEFPPPSAGKAATEMAQRSFPLVHRGDNL